MKIKVHHAFKKMCSVNMYCLQSHTNPPERVSNIVYAQANASYASILGAFVRNARFSTPSTQKPLLIVTPLSEHQYLNPIPYEIVYRQLPYRPGMPVVSYYPCCWAKNYLL
ncbi:Reticuline oxidase protein [Spatholobus suberectus]|nr:Reticuline oxidase protein [Spatholobus suberectus]